MMEGTEERGGRKEQGKVEGRMKKDEERKGEGDGGEGTAR